MTCIFNLLSPDISNIARNRNQVSKWAYFVLAHSFPTGLNGAFLSMIFRICDYWAYNWE